MTENCREMLHKLWGKSYVNCMFVACKKIKIVSVEFSSLRRNQYPYSGLVEKIKKENTEKENIEKIVEKENIEKENIETQKEKEGNAEKENTEKENIES